MPDTAAQTPRISGVFGLPFLEQIAFLRGRLGNLIPTSGWQDVMYSQHDRGFMVAGAARADLLADLAMAVDEAIAEGRGAAWFRDHFEEIVRRRGWTGWTGEGSKAGRAWRARVIYRTNLAVSYAAGRLAQLRAGGFRYWIYKHSDSVLHPRPLHLAWDGLVLPPDHPFWTQHFPPNGWGCCCRVIGVNSLDNARALGGDPDKVVDPAWSQIDPRTGEPVGIDRGWGYMPGATVVGDVLALRDKVDLALRDKLEELPRPLSISLIQDWLKSSAFARWFAKPSGVWPLVRLPPADIEAIGAHRAVADLSAETALKQALRHPEMTVFEYLQAQAVVDHPTVRIRDGANSLVYALVDPGDLAGGYVLVVKATRTGAGLFVTSYRRLSRVEALRDAEVTRLLARAGNE